MATIRDVAKAAGVSIATVSAVINDSAYVSPELRKRVQAAIDELNYTPSAVARNLNHGRSQLIAMVVADLANPFWSHLVCLAEAAAAAAGAESIVIEGMQGAPWGTNGGHGAIRRGSQGGCGANLAQKPHASSSWRWQLILA